MLAIKAALTFSLVFPIILAMAILDVSKFWLSPVMAPATAVWENCLKDSELFVAIVFNFSGLVSAILLITAKAILFVCCGLAAALSVICFISLLLLSTLVACIYLLIASTDSALPCSITVFITFSLIKTKAGFVLLVMKVLFFSDNEPITVAAASGFVSAILFITSPTFCASDLSKISPSKVFFCSGLVLLKIKSILEIFELLITSDWALISASSTIPSLLESFKVPFVNFFCNWAVKSFSFILEDSMIEVLKIWTSCFEASGITLSWKPWGVSVKPWLGWSIFWVPPEPATETDPVFPKLSGDKNILNCPPVTSPLTKVPLNLTSESCNFIIIFPLALLISPLSIANCPPLISKINFSDFFSKLKSVVLNVPGPFNLIIDLSSIESVMLDFSNSWYSIPLKTSS